MVRNHVPQRARLLVVAAAVLDPELLGDRDLHVIDVAAVPHRLEDPVGEAEDEDVLHRLLAQVVIDPVDLLLAQVAAELPVEGARRLQVVPEGLLHHHPSPGGPVFAGQTGSAEPARHLAKEEGGVDR